MDIFVYSDESGVFDKVHNDYFVYGGLIFLGRESMIRAGRKYSHVEEIIRTNGNYTADEELKATRITNSEKGKLYRSLNNEIKFGAIVKQEKISDGIYSNKKSKQRYLDYVYKMALKSAFKRLISLKYIKADEVESIHVFCDEHTTATNGRYELREALEQELKIGTTNFKYAAFYPPIFKDLKNVNVKYCDSKTTLLIKAADIVANRIYYNVCNDNMRIKSKKMFLKTFP